MKGRITLDSMVHEFRLLRNRIESEIHAPALVFVTSATDDDGAGLTAYGLAESLSKTNQRIVLVTTDPTITSGPSADDPTAPPVFRRRASDRLESGSRPSRAHGDGRFEVISVSPERLTTISRSNVAEMFQDLRSRHDYVVIDAGNLPKNSFALLLVGLADVALVAFRSGRAQQPADRTMLDTLERAETKILGAVMTDTAAIEHFARRNEPEPVAQRAPAPAVAPAPQREPAAFVTKRLGFAFNRIGKSN
jgi:Mrp family chromosome partitioning ATPase